MTARTNRRWLVARHSDGEISEANFRWVESPVPTPADGQFLARNLWFSFEPTQRFLIAPADPAVPDSGGIPLGEAMSTIAVSRIVESRHPEFSPGQIVHGHMGWEDYSVTDGKSFSPTYRVPDGIPPNWALGVFGLTGLVAYFGIHEVARPKRGETIVISGAAGGVGSIASQLAKIHGLRVIGVAGSAAKCEWLTREAGVDAAINYKSEDVGPRLAALCPDGIDIFFDNDGGPLLDLALERLRQGGRVVLSGATSRYAVQPPPPVRGATSTSSWSTEGWRACWAGTTSLGGRRRSRRCCRCSGRAASSPRRTSSWAFARPLAGWPVCTPGRTWASNCSGWTDPASTRSGPRISRGRTPWREFFRSRTGRERAAVGRGGPPQGTRPGFSRITSK